MISIHPYLWALGELGQAELAGSPTNPRIAWYASFTTLHATDDETPWCSAFMCAAAESGGYPSTKSAAASSWLTYGEAGSGLIGEIAVFKRPGGHHVAFVHQCYLKGDSVIWCLGGNQKDQVCVTALSASHLLGFRKFTRDLKTSIHALEAVS